MLFRSSKSILCCIFAIVHTAAILSDDGIVAANPVLESQGCVAGDSASDCPKKWRFTGGAGYVGQRTMDENTKIMCSPTCSIRDGSVDKECSLIMVLHGIYSNPGDMIWLMLGSAEGNSDTAAEAFSETEENGGPFCISFHKSENDPWDYSCDKNDADHFKEFIPWILDEFPSIDPEAVFLHGFSSGAIMTNTLMFASCEIEQYVAGAAPYAGLIASPPTTKAAYLIPHGTHDNVVPYREDLTDGQIKATPSCECNGLAGGQSSCFFDSNWLSMVGTVLAAGIATLRGYQGDLFAADSALSPTSRLDLVDFDTNRCNEHLNRCINPLASPNPFNNGYDCNAMMAEETEVYEFPTTEDAGPVVLWKINYNNHDYPNKRRSSWGPTEFFFELKKFFYANRGRYVEPVRRPEDTVTTPGRACSDPGGFDDSDTTESLFRYDYWDNVHGGVTPEKCRQKCEADFRCTDAFYVDYRAYGFTEGCKLFFAPFECRNTFPRSYSGEIHFKMGDTNYSPTPPPVAPPVASPVAPPVEVFCSNEDVFNGGASAGYSCTTTGGDSNWGETGENCLSKDGQWIPYDCEMAQGFYTDLEEGDELFGLKLMFLDIWEPQCCVVTNPPVPAPTNPPTNPPVEGFCPEDEFNGGAPAGFHCTATQDDSNFGETEENCLSLDGDWLPYDCNTAREFYLGLEADDPNKPVFLDTWEPQCCGDIAPVPAPTNPPVDPPLEGFCAEDDFHGGAPAGFHCTATQNDSNFGETEENCLSLDGDWLPYDCDTAREFYLGLGADDPNKPVFLDVWEPQCCDDVALPPDDGSLCLGAPLRSDEVAGHACLVADGGSVGDSIVGWDEDDCAAEEGGTWTPYDCDTANDYFEYLTENIDFFRGAWGDVCCA